MTTNRSISFAELRRFLSRFGYVEKRIQKPRLQGSVFHIAGKDRLFYRLYEDDEPVDARDLHITRMFLDAWGYLDKKDFDAFLQQATTPA